MQWIKRSEQEPPKDEVFLIWEDGEYEKAHFREGDFCYYDPSCEQCTVIEFDWWTHLSKPPGE